MKVDAFLNIKREDSKEKAKANNKTGTCESIRFILASAIFVKYVLYRKKILQELSLFLLLVRVCYSSSLTNRRLHFPEVL